MSESTPLFRTTMRGYEPSAVDQYVAQLTAAIQAAQQHTAELTTRVDELTRVAEQAQRKAAVAPPSAPTFADFGERVGQILTMAEEEATQIRSSAAAEIEQKLSALEAANAKTRGDADRYANQTRLQIGRASCRERV